MIEKITIASIATYGDDPEIMDGLKPINYLYGANGAGKTTISRVLSDASRFPHCELKWKTRSPLDVLVYNRDFVDKHFHQNEKLPGIFTLGEKNADTMQKIESAKQDLDRLRQDTHNFNVTLRGSDGTGGKLRLIATETEKLIEACWDQKKIHDNKLKVAFEGYRNDRKRFMQKILAERENNTSDVKSLDYILDRAATVFSDGLAPMSPVPAVNPGTLLEIEKAPILEKRIIGRSDVDIAAMIQRLGNSDWVRGGRTFLASNDRVCPFCQQAVSEDFEIQLTAYFDETFERDMHQLDLIATQYAAETGRISREIEAIISNPQDQVDFTALVESKKLLDALFEINIQRLRAKQREPSLAATLQSSRQLIGQVSTIVESTNVAIELHNQTVKNLAKERSLLVSQVWRFLIDVPLKEPICAYQANRSELDKAVESIHQQIQDKEQKIRDKEAEIRELERSITSIQPTLDAINGLLSSFGFDGFRLSQAENESCYRLSRLDGSDAKTTLSEGEKTFVTFLYFYHLLKGSQTESGVTRDRVVVFDDPVSSLDCDILFIVSTLVRNLCDEIRAGQTTLKQLFVLTHNVYFHKEVTFQKPRNRASRVAEAFWTVRKAKSTSQIEMHPSNPIKSSYELLWLDVREARSDNRSVQNSLRRILETYFKMLGGRDLDGIYKEFDGKEKLACRALLSWVNDGSHSAHDDLYVAVDGSTVEFYLDVFRKIFENTGHIEHYNMMMASSNSVAVSN